MIRNPWVGQTGPRRHFTKLATNTASWSWQDFWLAKPLGRSRCPTTTLACSMEQRPSLYNVSGKPIPCIAIYAGRNEGYPPPFLDSALRPNGSRSPSGYHIHFSFLSQTGVRRRRPLPSSAGRRFILGCRGKKRMHTERGHAQHDELQKPANEQYPQSTYGPSTTCWGMHDFCLEGAQSAATL